MNLNPEAKKVVEKFYSEQVEPLLTPVTVDPAHPFPRVLNKALCVAFLLRRRRKTSDIYLGVVTVPRALPRLLRLPAAEGAIEFAFLHDIVHAYSQRLYHGYEILSAAPFRVTRNSNLYLREEESRSILDSVDTQLHLRRKGAAVRLEIEEGADPEIIERLRSNFALAAWQVFQVHGPINLSRLFNLYEQTPRPDLKFRPFTPKEFHLKPGFANMFELLRKHDVLLHHPYDSYSTVVQFIESAVHDPDVLSIKQTLYRTSEDSPIVRALMQAAAKKEVTVVVELKARFDEASNIRWAKNLQEAGVQVYHGLVGLKTHCKLALLVRRDKDGKVRRYAHLGTGNYNPSTARFYTDLSLFTHDAKITEAVHHVFNYLTAYSERSHYGPLSVAPLNLGKNCVSLIEREAAHARAGRPAFIVAKVNSLTRRENHSGALCRLASGRRYRIDCSRRLRAASRNSGNQQPDSRAQHRGPLSGAQPDFLFCEWRAARSVSGQRRLDAAESLRARRSDVPVERSGAVPAGLQNGSGTLSCRHGEGPAPAAGWNLREGAQSSRKFSIVEWHAVQRSGIPDGAVGRAGNWGRSSWAGAYFETAKFARV